MTKAVSAARVATTNPKSVGPKAHMVGGGIGSLAAAAFMIRDGGVRGRNITIYEAMPVLGGSLDGGGSAAEGYTLRGGRMLTTDNYELLGAVGARAGGANMMKAAIRVTFWGALAMAVTAGIGAIFGAISEPRRLASGQVINSALTIASVETISRRLSSYC
jgi:hypothetical protein